MVIVSVNMEETSLKRGLNARVVFDLSVGSDCVRKLWPSNNSPEHLPVGSEKVSLQSSLQVISWKS